VLYISAGLKVLGTRAGGDKIPCRSLNKDLIRLLSDGPVFVHCSLFIVLHLLYIIMPYLRPNPRAQVFIAIVFLLTSTYLIASYPSTPAFPTFKPEPDFKYHSDAVEGEPKRIAIIGAGASGSAAAWFLSRAGRVMKERTGRELIGEITVLERDERVGGRKSPIGLDEAEE
jgi:hypothetical protein